MALTPKPLLRNDCLAQRPPSGQTALFLTLLFCSQSCVFMAVGRIVMAVAQKFRFAGRKLMRVR